MWKSVSSFLLLTFLVCMLGGMFCPMSSAAAEGQSSNLPSHHSSPFPQEKCPDQLKASSEFSQELVSPLMAHTEGPCLDSPIQVTTPTWRMASVPSSSSYPLLYLRFSVLLN